MLIVQQLYYMADDGSCNIFTDHSSSPRRQAHRPESGCRIHTICLGTGGVSANPPSHRGSGDDAPLILTFPEATEPIRRARIRSFISGLCPERRVAASGKVATAHLQSLWVSLCLPCVALHHSLTGSPKQGTPYGPGNSQLNSHGPCHITVTPSISTW